MGLDMYLTGNLYVKNWNHMAPEELYEVIVKNNDKLIDCQFPVKEIVYEIGCWRKANAIHQWFVKNIQKDIDDCGTYYVERKSLSELLDLVKEILEDRSQAKKLLPTQSGFFFGGTEYDEYYFEDLEQTKNILTKALSSESDDLEFYYRSSW